MDCAGAAPTGRSLSKLLCALCLVLCVCFWLSSRARADAATDQQLESVRALARAERWQDIVDLLKAVRNPCCDLQFYYGSALARLSRWDEAEGVLARAERLRPGDKRFPQELAGINFKQKRYSRAARQLGRALKLDPKDSYTLEFLATVYFLEGNLEAALRSWNRIQKPQIASILLQPPPKLNSEILDHAFALSENSSLTWTDFLTTEERIRELGIFAGFQFALQARQDGRFDFQFRNREITGCGGKWECLITLFDGLPAESISPRFFNLRHQAINVLAFYRWDAQKRRIQTEWSGPLGGEARHRYSLSGDVRNENWDLRKSFTGPAPLLGSLNLRRQALEAKFSDIESGRWRWSGGAELSHRDFRNPFGGDTLTRSLLAEGDQLKQITRVDGDLWRLPEHRLVLAADARSEIGRIWSAPSQAFAKLQAGSHLDWFPQAKGDDYEMEGETQVGRGWGGLPFDELSTMGILGDADLLMRAHIATRDGRKGSAPLGEDYTLSNWDSFKNVYDNAPFTVRVGPFVDTGKISDASPGLGSHEWLWDVGVEARIKLFGAGVVLSYGKDLRSGNNAITVRLQ
jgi:hypothetical protein